MAAVQKPIVKAEYTDPSHNTAMVLLEGEADWHMVGKFTHPDIWVEMLQSQQLRDYQSNVTPMPSRSVRAPTINLNAEVVEPQMVPQPQPVERAPEPQQIAAPAPQPMPQIDLSNYVTKPELAAALDGLQQRELAQDSATTQQIFDRIGQLEQRDLATAAQLQDLAQRQQQPPPPPGQPPVAPMAEQPEDNLPAFLRDKTTSTASPLAPVAPDLSHIEHDIANLKQHLAIIEDSLSRKPEPPPAPPVREMARMDIINAGRRRRAAAVPYGDVARMLILENTALLAQSGQEAAFTLLGVLAEAEGLPASSWGEVAKRIVRQADILKHITVRSTAVETKALAEVTMAETDEMAQRIARGAVEAIGAIEG